LVNGDIIKSTDKEINVNKVTIKHLQDLLSMNFLQLQSDSAQEELFKKDTLIWSFSDPTLCLDYNDMRLKHMQHIAGNVILYSAKHLDLTTNLNLKDVILVAPSLKFPSNYKGVLQALCSDSIVLESGVLLDYPSAIVLIKKNIINAQAQIILKEQAQVNGILFAYSQLENDDKIYIHLRSKALVRGQLYSAGSIDCQGIVYGGLMCKSLLLKTNTSINENYLLNATIDVKKRSIHYTGSNLLPAKNKKRIIKYL
jgi:hypothetical protein